MLGPAKAGQCHVFKTSDLYRGAALYVILCLPA